MDEAQEQIVMGKAGNSSIAASTRIQDAKGIMWGSFLLQKETVFVSFLVLTQLPFCWT